jgi:transglutaminase-like putative cysteine protease
VVLALALALPLLGAWVASTLVVHHESSREMAVAVGLGIALVFPLAWEFLSLPPRQPGGARSQRLLKLRTRLLLRTWAVNFLFMAGALLISPRGVFTALSTRGDWMLPASGGPAIETARRLLFTAADGVEWAYVLATDNPYKDQLIALVPRPPPQEQPRPGPRVEPLPSPSEPQKPSSSVTPPTAEDPAKEPGSPTGDTPQDPPDDGDSDVMISWKPEPKPPGSEPEPEPKREPKREPVLLNPDNPIDLAALKWKPEVPPSEKPAPFRGGGRFTYPFLRELHPAVASVPSHMETDLASVAKYLVSRERDPFQRVKALHDYVADRVVYDVESLRTRNFASQLPADVFKSRKGVCAGYSNLLAAMGQAAGEEIVSIVGESLSQDTESGYESHAWNAARIEGEWYLLDATWDAGAVLGDLYGRGYGTTYLFMPPRQFLSSHIPDDPAWQLLDPPLSRGEAMRSSRGPSQDMSTRPTAPAPKEPAAAKPHAWDTIRIREPERPRAEVKGRFHVVIDNPQGLPAEVILHNTQDGSQEPCHPEYRGARYTCTALTKGLYRIHVNSGPRDMNPQLMATLEVLAL